MHVHPFFMMQLEQVPLLVLYQLVLVNYGAFASPDDAETFGAAALGLSKDEYYHTLCGLADELAPTALPGLNNRCLAFDKNRTAFVELMATIRNANAAGSGESAARHN